MLQFESFYGPARLKKGRQGGAVLHSRKNPSLLFSSPQFLVRNLFLSPPPPKFMLILTRLLLISIVKHKVMQGVDETEKCQALVN
jgi:hypothetical protein